LAASAEVAIGLTELMRIGHLGEELACMPELVYVDHLADRARHLVVSRSRRMTRLRKGQQLVCVESFLVSAVSPQLAQACRGYGYHPAVETQSLGLSSIALAVTRLYLSGERSFDDLWSWVMETSIARAPHRAALPSPEPFFDSLALLLSEFTEFDGATEQELRADLEALIATALAAAPTDSASSAVVRELVALPA
jgi:hypothetical protein